MGRGRGKSQPLAPCPDVEENLLMHASNDQPRPDRDSIEQRVIEIICLQGDLPANRVRPDTDVVSELGMVGEDGWKLLDTIAQEFSLAPNPNHHGPDLYARFGDEATLPVPPLTFVVLVVAGSAIWIARTVGLHNRRIEDLIVWPPWKCFRSNKASPLLVSEIVDEVMVRL
jgi:hypothetical protein